MKTHLPFVANEPSVTTQGNEYGLTARAYLFAMAWLQLLSDERRALLQFDERLVRAAQEHAEYLDSRTGLQLLESMHLGRDGSWSNGRVMEAGYRLPRGYSSVKNNVESCSRDSDEPANVALRLAGHEPHRSHMLGLDGFVDRVVWGIGNAGDDYVFIAAPMEAL